MKHCSTSTHSAVGADADLKSLVKPAIVDFPMKTLTRVIVVVVVVGVRVILQRSIIEHQKERSALDSLKRSFVDAG